MSHHRWHVPWMIWKTNNKDIVSNLRRTKSERESWAGWLQSELESAEQKWVANRDQCRRRCTVSVSKPAVNSFKPTPLNFHQHNNSRYDLRKYLFAIVQRKRKCILIERSPFGRDQPKSTTGTVLHTVSNHKYHQPIASNHDTTLTIMP